MTMPADPQRQEPAPLPPPTNVPPAPTPAPITINVPPAPTPAPEPQPQGRWTDEDLERVRREEKAKLYPELEELRETQRTLVADLEARREAEEAAQRAAAEEERQRQEAEMTAMERFEAYNSDMEARFAKLEADRAAADALVAKERQLVQLERYKSQRLTEEADTIAPQLVGFVTGNTEEEIEASIIRVQQSTNEILAEVQQGQQQQRREIPMPVTGGPPIDMQNFGEQQRTLSADEIRDMDMSTYAQYREQLLGAGSQRVREQGLYAP